MTDNKDFKKGPVIPEIVLSPKRVQDYKFEDLLKELQLDLSGDLNVAVNEVLNGKITKLRERTGMYQRYICSRSYIKDEHNH